MCGVFVRVRVAYMGVFLWHFCVMYYMFLNVSFFFRFLLCYCILAMYLGTTGRRTNRGGTGIKVLDSHNYLIWTEYDERTNPRSAMLSGTTLWSFPCRTVLPICAILYPRLRSVYIHVFVLLHSSNLYPTIESNRIIEWRPPYVNVLCMEYSTMTSLLYRIIYKSIIIFVMMWHKSTKLFCF